MAIDNAEAVKFCNDKVRVAADKLAQAYFFAKQVQAEWFANNMGAVISVDGGEVLDGAATDGRHVITGNDATNVIVRCGDMISDLEADGNAKLNTVLAAAVNY